VGYDVAVLPLTESVRPPSVVRLPDQWFIACRSRDLERRPRPFTLQGTPLALFRDAGGRAAALLDRCPHRNAPLSLGRVTDGALECGYHGWRFEGDGACRLVPGLAADAQREARRATAFATAEQDGFVWVYSTPDAAPRRAPFEFPLLADARYTTVRRTVDVGAPVWHTLENALDVPHTAFLHRGLFRTAGTPHEVEVVVRRDGERAEAEYVGEPRPAGLVGRLLAPGGGVVEHVDRFLLPSIAQVEYRLGDANHLLVTSFLTPIDDFLTRQWAVISFRLRLPGWLVAPLVSPVATRILRQDAAILARQSAVIRRFGGEAMTSTSIDVLGPQIWRLLQAAGGDGNVPPHEHRVRLRI
jgi:phenylpropionate dioxygenase-like ring-hydroxylating dioxygenase large terminal subunit